MPDPTNLLLRLDAVTPITPEHPTQEDLIPWRDRIDVIDRLMINLLNERANCAVAIGHIKRKVGLPVYVPAREEDVLNNVSSANPGPLSNQAVRRLYERIIDETRSLERQLSENDV
ncbi:MAG: chorismate mutase [Bacteroidetes Order II. Incertae sedis bacterium]|nr:chorismate mutase [Bacteroidetes Order II. bacterium]